MLFYGCEALNVLKLWRDDNRNPAISTGCAPAEVMEVVDDGCKGRQFVWCALKLWRLMSFDRNKIKFLMKMELGWRRCIRCVLALYVCEQRRLVRR